MWSNPQVALVISLFVFVGAALIDRLWLVLGLIPVAVTVGWALLDGCRFQRLAVCVLFLSQLLMVVPWLHPEEYNYAAYAILLLAIAGGTATLHRGVKLNGALGFAVWLVLSATYSTVVLHPVPLYALMLMPVGIVGMLLLFSGESGTNEGMFIRALLGFATCQALLGLAQTLFDLGPFAALGGTVYSEPRNYLAWLVPGVSSQVRMATGTFEHFNGLGSLLCLATPIALGLWLRERKASRLVLLLLLTAGLVATFSRGALLGSLIGGALVYWSTIRGSRVQSLRITSLALVGVLSGVAMAGTVQEYTAATNNLSSRVEAWSLALHAIIADPTRLLFGAGFGYFGAGFLASQGAVARLHSAPVQVLAELGVVGVGLFLLGVLRPVWRGLRSQDPTQNLLAASAVAFLVHQVVDNAMFGFVGLVFFAFVALLIARQWSEARAESLPICRETAANE